MPHLLLGVLAALGAAALFAVGIGLQALEARAEAPERALRLRLFLRLVRRPRWLAGTALGVLGWGLQAYALTQAPLTLVQPLLGASLVFLLPVSLRLGERIGRGERLAVLAVAGGIPLLALTAPARESSHAEGASLWIALGALAAVSLAPLALRGAARSASLLVPVGAGVAYSLDGLTTKFAADDATRHVWLGLLFWAAAMGAASALGTLGEMSALQRRPVAHVAPIVFALTTFVPVGLAPLLAGEWWPASPLRDAGIAAGLAAAGLGALVLARVAPLAPASSSESGTAWTPRRASEEASAAASRLS
jgi:drug/metabolite transporter (DMT)-like permease